VRRAFLVLVLASAGAIQAAESDWLRRAAQADAGVARQATWQIEVFPTATATTSRVHLATDGQGRTRREHLSGPSEGLVVIADGASEWRREAGSEVWRKADGSGHGEMGLAGDDLTRIGANYTCAASRAGALLGRAAVLLVLKARHGGNPSRRLWLDAENGLLLRAEVYNREGQLVTRSVCQDLALGAPDAARLRVPEGARRDESRPFGSLVRCASLAELARKVGGEVEQPSRLPAGYALHEVFGRVCQRGYQPVLTWSDGLNTLTAFRRGPGAGRGRGRGQCGRCVVESSRLQVVVTVSTESGQWVVVGDLERAQLEKMAQSLAG
jgi:negative regulator of sigma E activity